MKLKILIVLNAVSLIFMIVINVLANALPINGKNTGELSALYPNEFVPAGYTFSIWGLIYLSLVGFCIFQYGSIKNQSKRAVVEKIGWSFIILNLLNCSWIFAWHYRLVSLSVLVMLAILFVLIHIHVKLPIPDSARSIQEKTWVQIPFSIYLGWIMTATIANITAWLIDKHWYGDPLTQNLWTIIMISIAGVLSLYFLVGRKNLLIPCVTVWSIVGIITRQYWLNGFNSIATTGAIVCAILLVAVLMGLTKKSADNL